MEHQTDFLVIGSGVAGMSFALHAAEHGKVILLTKTSLDETNTKYAQGGIATVMYQPDDFEKHIQDTLIAGDGLCDERIVRMVVNEAPEQIKTLVSWGAHFDKTSSGRFDLNMEGGHSEHRILHHKDQTGKEIIRALINRVRNHSNIKVFEHYFTLELITQHHLGVPVFRGKPDIECYGAYVLNIHQNRIETILGKVTMLATGGNGFIYQTTTNPPIATGDGLAMAYRAKAFVENTEFVQFHPTSLYHPGERPSFLITEAIRGFGAILKTIDGEEFMHKYDPRKSLAPRDIVARAIDTEMKNRGDDYVLLDCTHLDTKKLKDYFPHIFQKCQSVGIDITKTPIPVVPAAHYSCGGVRINENGQTTICNLYASGEVANSGLHGANRLASNSLIEAVVISHRAAIDAIRTLKSKKIHPGIPAWNDEGTSLPEEMVLITQSIKELQQIMSNYVGIVRSNIRLKRALDRLEILYRETEDLYERSTISVKLGELRNAINVAYLIVRQAQQRRESRGLHYNIDFPNKNKL
ncbi:MAG: L-aspartate oxidase [Bacteroidales bacterium]|nr:L-aspartate oxidase [Bacteroidales bacterium]